MLSGMIYACSKVSWLMCLVRHISHPLTSQLQVACFSKHHALCCEGPSDGNACKTSTNQQGLRAAGSALSGIRALRQSRSASRTCHSQAPAQAGTENIKSLYGDAVTRQSRWQTGAYTEATLTGHAHNVECLQLVQSDMLGQVVVSASWDHDVRVWCCCTNECIRQLVGHTAWITCMLTAGGWVVSGGLDHSLCAWRYEDATARSPTTVLRHPGPVTAACWLHTGARPPSSASRGLPTLRTAQMLPRGSATDAAPRQCDRATTSRPMARWWQQHSWWPLRLGEAPLAVHAGG